MTGAKLAEASGKTGRQIHQMMAAVNEDGWQDQQIEEKEELRSNGNVPRRIHGGEGQHRVIGRKRDQSADFLRAEQCPGR